MSAQNNNYPSEHPLVSGLVKDQNNPPDIVIIYGYVGNSASDEAVRLYNDLQFREFVEIRKTDIIKWEEVSENILPFGGTAVFVKQDAEVTLRKIEESRVPAKYLRGQISEKSTRANQAGSMVQILGGTTKGCTTNPSDTCKSLELAAVVLRAPFRPIDGSLSSRLYRLKP